jgi:hypothetical protein
MAETITNALGKVRAPDRLTLILSAAAVLGSALVLPTIYRDYRTFRSYGPGGIPNNVIGWLTVRALFQPFKREMFSTEEYVKRVEAAEGHGKGDEGFLELSSEQLASRSVTDRPVVGPHVVPQRQLTQIPDEDLMEVSLCLCPGLWMCETCFANLGRNSARRSTHSVCGIIISSSSSSRIWRVMPMGFSWRIICLRRIWR